MENEDFKIIPPVESGLAVRAARPDWLKVRLPGGDRFFELKKLVRNQKLNTVCEDARCPNIAECWSAGTATFMILGDICTRSCGFCSVKSGRPEVYDPQEPKRVASAVQRLGLRYAVITSVDRDDLVDGGASIFAETIHELRRECLEIQVEVLIPDFRGSLAALRAVVEARPDVLAHNIETVPRLYPIARAGSRYQRSLEQLRRAKDIDETIPTKSSLMIGLGERRDEILETLHDLESHGVDIITIGQYLQPTRNHLPVDRYYPPAEFSELQRYAEGLSFRHVESGPLVRSSYLAERQFRQI